MQKFASSLLDAKVFVFQASGLVGKVTKLINNPNNLNIEVLEVEINPKIKRYVLTKDIKSVADKLIIIESTEDLSEKEDLIRQKQLIESGFSAIKCSVKTQDGKRIGKVKDYTIDINTYKTMKLHVSAPLMKRLLNERHIIDIKDVIKVEGKTIIVQNTKIKAKQKLSKPLPAGSS